MLAPYGKRVFLAAAGRAKHSEFRLISKDKMTAECLRRYGKRVFSAAAGRAKHSEFRLISKNKMTAECLRPL